MSFFFRSDRQTAVLIALKFCIAHGVSLRNLWRKEICRISSGHGVMASLVVQFPTDFSTKSFFSNLLPMAGIETSRVA